MSFFSKLFAPPQTVQGKGGGGAPKQDFLRTALLMMVIFLGYNLIFNNKQPNQKGESLDTMYARVQNDNARLLDVNVVSDVQNYDKALDQEVNDKRMTRAEADDRQNEAAILQADTQYKSGLYRVDTGKIRNAYQSLLVLRKRINNTPAWSTSYDVQNAVIPGPATYKDGGQISGSITTFDWKSWTPSKMYKSVVDEMSIRNRTDYVYGFIPGYQLVDFLVNLTGAVPSFSYAFAAFLLALVVRGSVFPLTQKQLMFSRQMQQLVPMTKEIKDKYKGDNNTQQQKIMELYREYGINPLAGCLPMFIQLPLFWAVYGCILRYQFQFQKGTFLWINPVTSHATHGFTATDLGQADPILIILYGLTMISATLLTPVTDPTQVKQQRGMGLAMGAIFTVFMFTGAFPVVGGFVLYWTFTNILATAQSLRAYRMPLPPLVKVSAQGGGALPRPTGKWQQMMDKIAEEQARQSSSNGKPAPPDDKPNRNGSSNNVTPASSEPVKTGTPAKHKPKKRK